MKKRYLIALNKSLRDFVVLPVADERLGGWYRAEGDIKWYGPGSVIQTVEIDTDDHSSRGNPEFKSGDLVEVWDRYNLRISRPRSQAAGEICMYMKTLRGRKEAEVLYKGEIRKVYRDSICPLPDDTKDIK